MTTQSTQIFVPLSKLDVAPENTRKTGATERQDELMASLTAYGQLQPFLVRPSDKKGRFYVVDGQRRLLALKAMSKAKTINTTYPVKCEEVDADMALELSLTANIQTQAMNPADQFEAFYAMSKSGLAVAEIAARFGVSKTIIRQRLKLASISPKLLDLYRQGETSLDVLEAFTLTDDHEKQEKLWEQLSEWQRRPHNIRHLLTEDKVSSEDGRVNFVTIEAYKAAGGHIERDLFSEEAFLTDIDLLNQLVTDKLQAAADEVKAEGWAFVERSPVHDYEAVREFGRVYPEPVKLTEEEDARLEAIEKEIRKLEETYNNAEGDTDEIEKQHELLEAEYDELVEKMEAFTDEQKNKAGAYVTVYRDGDLNIIRGLVRPENQAEDEPKKKEKKPQKAISDRLMERLSAHKTLALQDALARAPEKAFDLLLAEMADDVLDIHASRSCFKFYLGSPDLPHDDESLKDCHAAKERQQQVDKWSKIIEGRMSKDTSIYDVVSRLEQKQKMQLLAFCFSTCINAVIQPKKEALKGEQKSVDHLATLLGLDMTEYWQPTAESYFSHISKDNILAAVSKAKGLEVADSLKKLKKADLAKAAEVRLADSDWLPQPLRIGASNPEKELSEAA